MNITYIIARRVLISLLALSLMMGLSQMSFADVLPTPTGKVLLTVSGNISLANSDSGAQFDYAMLSELGLVDKKIATHWTGPDNVFTGVLTRDLMTLVGAKGNWIRAVAANDYSVNFPLTDLTRFETMFGLSQNGQRLKLRDKGPLWLLYPNDSRPDELDSTINKRMIWQLKSLHIQ